jgi:molybdopterin synthase catalytic subunit
MRIEIQLTRERISTDAARIKLGEHGSGALVEFTGIVRGEESGHTIAALEYEAYDAMAERVMRQICESLGTTQPCNAVVIVHRVGVIPVGEAAIYVCAAARHRAEAFALVTGFMDRLKQDVPIWKCRALTRDELKSKPT